MATERMTRDDWYVICLALETEKDHHEKLLANSEGWGESMLASWEDTVARCEVLLTRLVNSKLSYRDATHFGDYHHG